MNEREKLNRAVSEARDFNPYPGEFLEREFEVYRRLREHLPIARSEAMGSSTPEGFNGGWVLTRYEDGCEVLSDPERFSNQSAADYPIRPWIPQAIDPPIFSC